MGLEQGAVKHKSFTSFKVGATTRAEVFHIQFTNDTLLIIGEMSLKNIFTIKSIFKVFFW